MEKRVKCRTEKELSNAVKNNVSEIEVDMPLGKHVIHIKAIGPVAWGICFTFLVLAVKFYIATPAATITATPVAGGACLVGGVTMSAAATAALGTAVVPAVTIGVCAGGVGVLRSLRDKYKIIEKTSTKVILKRK